MKVRFIPTEFIDPCKYKSELKLNEVFKGTLSNDKKSVAFKDQADCEWVFYVGLTCILLPLIYTINHPESSQPIEIKDLNGSIEIARDYLTTGEDSGFWKDILSQLTTIKNSLN